ncbi:cytidine deaminase family protein [Jiangella aurantiaca]|uniref:cytidine deaminase family protein n=1 Tax=Jiangella aurantiaca TaxID=2530373 RepID=UPI00193CB8A0|nr:hypothetical protein [Jiangella aurantiaca]
MTAYADLIDRAQALLNRREVDGRLKGDVAATLVTDRGQTYSGVCLDTPCGTEFCAEQAAVAAMITAGEYRVAAIVAVCRSSAGELFVVPPCGRCRELLRQVDEGNLTSAVVVDGERSMPLRELPPSTNGPRRSADAALRRHLIRRLCAVTDVGRLCQHH